MERSGQGKVLIIVLLVIIAVVLIVIAYALLNRPATTGQVTLNNREGQVESSSSNINVEVESGGDFLTLTHNCFWAGMEIRCNGEVKDIDTKPHTTGDIYIDMGVTDKKCCYCFADRINFGSFGEGKVRTYTLSCDVKKKTDVIVTLTLSGGASQSCISSPDCEK